MVPQTYFNQIQTKFQIVLSDMPDHEYFQFKSQHQLVVFPS